MRSISAKKSVSRKSYTFQVNGHVMSTYQKILLKFSKITYLASSTEADALSQLPTCSVGLQYEQLRLLWEG